MRIVAVGRAVDVRGFALAGVETRCCSTDAEARVAVPRLAAERPAPGLVVLSPWAATVAARALARIRGDTTRPPVLVVLPEGREERR
jgi:vacuolar-type H+-ATPase subunit F/Vma7